MKNIMLLVAVSIGLLFVACNGGDTDSHAGHNHSSDNSEMSVVNPSYNLKDVELQTHVDEYMHYYSHIQEALAKDDAEAVLKWAALAKDFIESLEKTKLSNADIEAYDKYMNPIKPYITELTTSENIDTQRTIFESLSNATYEFAKAFGTSEPIYQAYCPMAFDGEGAFWLTETNEIANPYYGSDMYSCGSIKKVIKK